MTRHVRLLISETCKINTEKMTMSDGFHQTLKKSIVFRHTFHVELTVPSVASHIAICHRRKWSLQAVRHLFHCVAGGRDHIRARAVGDLVDDKILFGAENIHSAS